MTQLARFYSARPYSITCCRSRVGIHESKAMGAAFPRARPEIPVAGSPCAAWRCSTSTSKPLKHGLGHAWQHSAPRHLRLFHAASSRARPLGMRFGLVGRSKARQGLKRSCSGQAAGIGSRCLHFQWLDHRLRSLATSPYHYSSSLFKDQEPRAIPLGTA